MMANKKMGVLVLKEKVSWEQRFKKLLKEIKGRPFTEVEALAYLYCYGMDFQKADADGVGADISGGK